MHWRTHAIKKGKKFTSLMLTLEHKVLKKNPETTRERENRYFQSSAITLAGKRLSWVPVVFSSANICQHKRRYSPMEIASPFSLWHLVQSGAIDTSYLLEGKHRTRKQSLPWLLPFVFIFLRELAASQSPARRRFSFHSSFIIAIENFLSTFWDGNHLHEERQLALGCLFTLV